MAAQPVMVMSGEDAALSYSTFLYAEKFAQHWKHQQGDPRLISVSWFFLLNSPSLMDQTQAVTVNPRLGVKQQLCAAIRLNICVRPIPPGRANHWSAIIGASHSKNYVLWEYGGYASDGVKQVAELGSPVKMEEEIRQKVSRRIAVLTLSRWKVSLSTFCSCLCAVFYGIFPF